MACLVHGSIMLVLGKLHWVNEDGLHWFCSFLVRSHSTRNMLDFWGFCLSVFGHCWALLYGFFPVAHSLTSLGLSLFLSLFLPLLFPHSLYVGPLNLSQWVENLWIQRRCSQACSTHMGVVLMLLSFSLLFEVGSRVISIDKLLQ